jgi:hypothetical protein
VDGFEFFDLSDLMARGFERKGRIENFTANPAFPFSNPRAIQQP